MSNFYSKPDIDVHEIKVKTAIIEFSARSHVCLCIYVWNTYVHVQSTLSLVAINFFFNIFFKPPRTKFEENLYVIYH